MNCLYIEIQIALIFCSPLAFSETVKFSLVFLLVMAIFCVPIIGSLMWFRNFEKRALLAREKINDDVNDVLSRTDSGGVKVNIRFEAYATIFNTMMRQLYDIKEIPHKDALRILKSICNYNLRYNLFSFWGPFIIAGSVLSYYLQRSRIRKQYESKTGMRMFETDEREL